MSARLGAVLLYGVGITCALVVALWPTSTSFLGTTVDCGHPVGAAFADRPGDSPPEVRSVVTQCRGQSRERLTVALVLLASSLLTGSAALRIARDEPVVRLTPCNVPTSTPGEPVGQAGFGTSCAR